MTWLQHNWLTVATIAYFALPMLGHVVGLFSPKAGSVLEAIGALTTEVSKLNRRLTNAASLPDIQEAIEDEREITEVTHLKAELADAKARAAEDKALASKRRDFWFGMFALAAATAAGSIATALVLRRLKI